MNRRSFFGKALVCLGGALGFKLPRGKDEPIHSVKSEYGWIDFYATKVGITSKLRSPKDAQLHADWFMPRDDYMSWSEPRKFEWLPTVDKSTLKSGWTKKEQEKWGTFPIHYTWIPPNHFTWKDLFKEKA